MNTAENPRTKKPLSSAAEARDPMSVGASRTCRCSDWPATYERYAGTSGSTHGDRNETSPAAKAVVSPSAAGSLNVRAPAGLERPQPPAWVAGYPASFSALASSPKLCPVSTRTRLLGRSTCTSAFGSTCFTVRVTTPTQWLQVMSLTFISIMATLLRANDDSMQAKPSNAGKVKPIL